MGAKINFISSFFSDTHFIIGNETSIQFSSNSEAFASELREHITELFHFGMFGKFKSSTTYNSVIRRVRVKAPCFFFHSFQHFFLACLFRCLYVSTRACVNTQRKNSFEA